MCGYSFIGEQTIKAQVELDEINTHKTPRVRSKVKIILCTIKIYHSKYLEYICSIFDQVRPVVSHLEVNLPDKPITPKDIIESLNGRQRQ